MRTAIVHDWLTGMRGGERVLHDLCGLLPDADLYTLVHVPGSTSERIEARTIHASPLSRIPGAGRHYRKFLPLFPWAIERFHLENYDFVLSISHAVAKGIPIAPGTPHLSYLLTPMRYVWDQIDAYLGTGLLRAAATPLVAYLRRWDVRTAGPDHVTRYVAISETVRGRIQARYGRPSGRVYPPVDVDRVKPDAAPPDPWFLLVGAFAPYKREDLAIRAFADLDAELRVVGDGPGRAALEAQAPPNVRFLGRVSDEELVHCFARCRALVYPQEEDFGIIAVEAQAAGRPVICFGRGGAAETVVPISDPGARAPTGVWFDAQEPAALAAAVERFLKVEAGFDPLAIRRHAEGFATPRFLSEMRAEIEALAPGATAGAGSFD